MSFAAGRNDFAGRIWPTGKQIPRGKTTALSSQTEAEKAIVQPETNLPRFLLVLYINLIFIC